MAQASAITDTREYLGRACVVDDVVLDVVRQASPTVQALLQLGVGDVAGNDQGSRQGQPRPNGIPAPHVQGGIGGGGTTGCVCRWGHSQWQHWRWRELHTATLPKSSLTTPTLLVVEDSEHQAWCGKHPKRNNNNSSNKLHNTTTSPSTAVLGQLREDGGHGLVQVHLDGLAGEVGRLDLGQVLRGVRLQVLDEHTVLGDLADRLPARRYTRGRGMQQML